MKYWNLLLGSFTLVFSFSALSLTHVEYSGGFFGNKKIAVPGNVETAEAKAYYQSFKTCALKNAMPNDLEFVSSCKKVEKINISVSVCTASVDFSCEEIDSPLALGYGKDGRYIQKTNIVENGRKESAQAAAIKNAFSKCDQSKSIENRALTASYCETEIQSYRGKKVEVCRAIGAVKCR